MDLADLRQRSLRNGSLPSSPSDHSGMEQRFNFGLQLILSCKKTIVVRVISELKVILIWTCIRFRKIMFYLFSREHWERTEVYTFMVYWNQNIFWWGYMKLVNSGSCKNIYGVTIFAHIFGQRCIISYEFLFSFGWWMIQGLSLQNYTVAWTKYIQLKMLCYCGSFAQYSNWL